MPELPEVETSRRGIAPHLEGHRVTRVIVRERRLRWPIPEDLDVRLSGQRIERVERRAKYLLIAAEQGTLIGHLGMSGSLRLVEAGLPAAKHEHVDIELDSGLVRWTRPLHDEIGRFTETTAPGSFRAWTRNGADGALATRDVIVGPPTAT